ncbi:MAG: hypothetical protein GXP10_04960, partial [Gammaproteobacteria bacterium]|nr:hypothetical protein [Gammaproteobacteria bacterium]
VDFQVAIGSLPRYFRPNLESFVPRSHGYLTASSELHDKWLARYAQLGAGMKVGISWRGGRKELPEIQQQRTTALAQWRELFEAGAEQVHFIDLQYGEHDAEVVAIEREQGVTLQRWADADPLKDLDDFAAQIAALDLVICVDNSTVHFAGSLGVPVWVLLPFEHDWRWMVAREASYWYSAVRLFHQQQQGEWQAVFQQVATALTAKLAQQQSQEAGDNDNAAEVG